METKFLNVAFYKFADLGALSERKNSLKRRGLDLNLKGTILLSAEGINGFLAGAEDDMRKFMQELIDEPALSELKFKESFSDELPFTRMLVKIKKEIIPMGRPDIRPSERTGKRLLPRDLKKWMDEQREMILIDTRNDYEVENGTFEGAMDLKLKNFREFGEKLKSLPAAARKKPVVMFCTGGIRCEKATALALQEGFADVYQLDGGILRYFEEVGNDHYKGDCFVFDNRVSVGPDLREKGAGYANGKARWKNQPVWS